MFGEFVRYISECDRRCINSLFIIRGKYVGEEIPATRKIDAIPTSSSCDNPEPSSSLDAMRVLRESLREPGFTFSLYSRIDMSQI
jgi:hypothetical protein